jgi:hypothetical protein
MSVKELSSRLMEAASVERTFEDGKSVCVRFMAEDGDISDVIQAARDGFGDFDVGRIVSMVEDHTQVTVAWHVSGEQYAEWPEDLVVLDEQLYKDLCAFMGKEPYSEYADE